MFAWGLCKFWICTWLRPLCARIKRHSWFIHVQARTENWMKALTSKKSPNQPSCWIPNCMWIQSFLENVTKRFLFYFINCVHGKKKKKQTKQSKTHEEGFFRSTITVTTLTQHLQDVSQLCTVSNYFKRDSSGNDFLFRVSTTGSRDVSWIHTYPMGYTPGDTFQRLQFGYVTKSKDYVVNKWLVVLR